MADSCKIVRVIGPRGPRGLRGPRGPRGFTGPAGTGLSDAAHFFRPPSLLTLAIGTTPVALASSGAALGTAITRSTTSPADTFLLSEPGVYRATFTVTSATVSVGSLQLLLDGTPVPGGTLSAGLAAANVPAIGDVIFRVGPGTHTLQLAVSGITVGATLTGLGANLVVTKLSS